ncbi:hypothetical protein E2C01_092448 [Portunus trituberculatus]|uniref:Uncharacterized protein n=1 Tax=Portunus trituberculatus TaxID=210409 RepID=A0A5B7JRS4_PORTR|nr:hypothetical protein [Portunus trituberculatus]
MPTKLIFVSSAFSPRGKGRWRHDEAVEIILRRRGNKMDQGNVKGEARGQTVKVIPSKKRKKEGREDTKQRSRRVYGLAREER